MTASKGNERSGAVMLQNPDKAGVYPYWHYCRVCGRVYDHSQRSLDDILYDDRHLCCQGALVNISTKIEEVEYV